ncbi:MAG: hypothetical protein ACERKO_07930 [Acetanaerobacterium sp.]
MDDFRRILKRRLALARIYNGMVVLLLGIGYIMGRENAAPDTAIGFASGFFIGIQFVMIYFMRKYHFALKDDEKLKSIYITENDERSKFIESQIGGTGVNVILGGIVLGTIVAGFLNETVFFTMLFTLLFSVLVKGMLKMYYNRKV